ncbi:MAG: hypothetical protein ACI84O_000367 [Myxococcota bacterium]|jgi:hypothetical protein
MTDTSRLLKFIFGMIIACCLSSDLIAQKQGRVTREFPSYGFSFRPLRDWKDIPQAPDDIARGRVGQFSADDSVRVSVEGNRGILVTPTLMILRDVPQAAVTEEKAGGLRGRVSKEKSAERTVHDYVISMYGGSLRKDEFKLLVPEESDPKIRKMEAKRQEITSYFISGGLGYDTRFDVYTIQLPNEKLIFVWNYPGGDRKDLNKWSKNVQAAMKTFKYDPDSVTSFDSNAAPDSNDEYDSILAFHEKEVAQTPGWRLIETKSKNYLIKTNCDDRKSISQAIKRLEASRRVYEEDFPPKQKITNVSVVRICNTREEFGMFSGMGDGVAGYFSPGSEELVLFFGENSTGLDLTLSVMSHEGFHQYGYFLFNRANPHQWFGEGHGDYYGAFKMTGSKLKPGEDMKGGLARLPEIARMIENGDIKPMAEHVRYSHSEWQNQGPSGVSCYAQSFTLVYFLREGAHGRISSKYFKKEYKDIIPNYLASVIDGYEAAYAEHVFESEAQLKLLVEADADEELIEALEKKIAEPWNYLDRQVEAQLRRVAIEESWGKIDEDEFHKNWLAFVENDLL